MQVIVSTFQAMRGAIALNMATRGQHLEKQLNVNNLLYGILNSVQLYYTWCKFYYAWKRFGYIWQAFIQLSHGIEHRRKISHDWR